MAVIARVIIRNVSREQYDAIRGAANWLAEAPAGGLGHLTWWEGDDCYNIDAWESEQAMAEFGEQRLGPAMAKVGVHSEPEITFYPAHEVFLPRQLTVTATAGGGTAPDNIALLRDGYAAFAAGDVPAVLNLFDPSIVWSTPETVRFGGSYLGPAGVGEFFSKLPENYAELRVEPETYVDRGDMVVVLGRHRGRSFAGAAFDIGFTHVWRLANGKAISFTEYFDTAKLNAVLGLPMQQTGHRSDSAVSA